MGTSFVLRSLPSLKTALDPIKKRIKPIKYTKYSTLNCCQFFAEIYLNTKFISLLFSDM